MGLQHYTQDMSKIPLKYHKKVLFYTKYTHPTLICRGTDARTDGRHSGISSCSLGSTDSGIRDKLLLLGEHGYVLLDLMGSVLSLFQFVGDCAARVIGRASR
jgi:hypothetical protein